VIADPVAPVAVAVSGDDEEDEEDDDEADEDEVEASLDVILKEKLVVADEEEDEEAPDTEERAEVTTKVASDNVAVLTGRGGVVTGLEVKVARPSTGTVATELFVYRTEALLDALSTLRAALDDEESGDSSGLGDFGEHLLPRLIETGTVRAVPMEGYWRDLGRPGRGTAQGPGRRPQHRGDRGRPCGRDRRDRRS